MYSNALLVLVVIAGDSDSSDDVVENFVEKNSLKTQKTHASIVEFNSTLKSNSKLNII